MVARKLIGVDIGSTAVRAAELGASGGRFQLVRMAQVPLPPGAVTNGEVRDPGVVGDALKELWHRGKFKDREVTLGVGNQRVVVREVSLPWLADKEMRESLPFQVQEFVPIPVEEAVLDYQIVEEFEQEGRRMVRLLLVAAQKAMVEQIVAAAEIARLRPAGLDLVPFAIMRSVGSVDGLGLEHEDPADEAVIDVGAEVTSVCVHANGLPRFVRMLPSGGRDITAAIAKGMEVSDDEAEWLKRGEEVEPDRAEVASRLGLARAASFVDEIRSSLDFYVSQMPGARIGRVLLTGGGSKLPGLPDLLDERLSAEVSAGHPLHRVTPAMDLPPGELTSAEPLLAVAVGLAIPGAKP